MERKIGEIFEYGGEWYQCVVAIQGCRECSFRTQDYCTRYSECFSVVRSDGRSVIFKKLEKVGESYTTFVDKTVQNYLLETAVSVPPKDVFTLINNEQRLIAIEIKQNKEDMEEKKLNLKPFDIQNAREGKPVCTRDGHKARIICFDSKNEDKTIVAAVGNDCFENLFCYTENGKLTNGIESDKDLMMLPEEKPKCEFKPFDRVLVRDLDFNIWYNDIFSFRDKDGRYMCIGNKWDECIPYNEETAHLLGTTDNFEDNK